MKKRVFILLGILTLLLVLPALAGSISASASEADRKIVLTSGRLVEYTDKTHTTIKEVQAIPLEDCWILPEDDIIVIRETDENWFSGFGTVHSLAAGCDISFGTSGATASNIPAGTKILIQETDETLHFAVSGGMSGTGVTFTDFNEIDFADESALEAAMDEYIRECHGGPANGQTVIKLSGKKFRLRDRTGKDLGHIVIEDGSIILHHDVYGKGVQVIIDRLSVEVALADIALELETTPTDIISVELGDFEVEIYPPFVALDFTPEFFISAQAFGRMDFRFTCEDGFKGKLSFGFIPHDFSGIHVDPAFGFNRVEVGGKFKVGIAWGPGVKLVHAVTLACQYEAGVVIEVWKSAESKDPGVDWHACEDLKCTQGKIYGEFGPWKIALIVAGKSKELLKISDEYDTPPFAHFYDSDTFKDKGMIECPHMGYRLYVHVVDQNGKALSDAKVSYTPEEKRFDKWGNNVSQEKDGNWRLYIPLTYPSSKDPEGKTNDVKVTASLPDPANPKQMLTAFANITEEGLKDSKPVPFEITLTLDMRRVTLSFEDGSPESGPASDIPDPISVTLGGSKGIQIPAGPPKKAGNHFIGWTTGKDGSGSKYSPGDTVDMTDGKDVTLYAQFRAILDTYVILYDANGGTDAPDPQVVKLGEKATLSSEPAKHEYYDFMGWSSDSSGGNLEFPYDPKHPGILDNKDNERVITLYAVWRYHPVSEPVKLSYNMNGGPESQKPEDRWVPRDTWVVLSSLIPVWDQMHTFRGWSTDPYANEAEYRPGEAVLLSDNLPLYAVWYFSPAPYPGKLQFRNSGSGTVKNMPADISFDPGGVVQIPDNIPTTSGQHFIGWNTDRGGGGDWYQPGTSFRPPDMMTLYAQWKPIRNSYVILYNANGGEYAPRAQVVSLDQIAVLSSDPARWEHHTFLGWAYDDTSSAPDFPAGQENVLNNPSGKPLITLYAVWRFDPVHKPAELSYDTNGGPKEQCPKSQFAVLDSFLSVDSAVLSWDPQHDFLGWSESSRSAAAQYHPGDSIRMIRDIRLYAVWKAHYKIIRGNGSKWRQRTTTGLRFVADGNIRYFHHLLIDGKVITSDRYTLTSGSTVADLPAKLLNSLPVGKHTITFVYDDGAAEGTFTILKRIPDTGDSSSPLLWALLVLLGLSAGYPVIRAVRKK